MHISGRQIENEAYQKAKDEAAGVKRTGASPELLKRIAAKKKAQAKAAKGKP